MGLASQWFDPLLWIWKIWGFSMTPHLWGCKSRRCGSMLTANLRLFQCSCCRFSSAISLFQLKKPPPHIPQSNSNSRVRDPWLVSPDILHQPDLHTSFSPSKPLHKYRHWSISFTRGDCRNWSCSVSGLSRDLINTYKYLRGGCQDSAGLFLLVPSNRTMDNGHERQHKKLSKSFTDE